MQTAVTTAFSEGGAASAPVAKSGSDARALVEFLLVGGATFLLLPLGWLLRHGVGLDDAELTAGFLTFYGAWVVNDPHFTVTYVLFYRDARTRALDRGAPFSSRLRWLVAGVAAPVVLVSWAAVAIRAGSAQTLGWLVQLMYFLVGWHYVKQGFGVLTVLAARRGVRLTARERVVFLAHGFAAWAYAWANPAMPAGEFEEKGVVYRAIARPPWLETVTGTLLVASAVALALTLAARRRRKDRSIPIVSMMGFLVTLWSWTIYSAVDPVLLYFIPALHSAQYLYFVWLMKRNEARIEEGPPSFGRPAPVRLTLLALSALALGALLFHGAPEVLDHSHRHATDPLGTTPWFAAFFVVVNIHHYVMDAVIWRRENPMTRFLLADPDAH
jgi:hypothetical protein